MLCDGILHHPAQVSEENKRKAEELLNKCTEMLRCIDQDCEVPVQGTFFVSPDERRGFRKARFVFNSDYVCWSMNEKVYQRFVARSVCP